MACGHAVPAPSDFGGDDVLPIGPQQSGDVEGVVQVSAFAGAVVGREPDRRRHQLRFSAGLDAVPDAANTPRWTDHAPDHV
ncbi:hypothetical protein [Streptomyces sp. NBC_01451]|uniref:hypothetical protein n=1 Tax=Streptomyces sp. NBC_01451 TaxID=2903872 RepID=UPI002E2FAC1D|nr:hypothetical protein [Streptomyces sp. NBC_01451]